MPSPRHQDPHPLCRVAYSDIAADSRLSVAALEGGRWLYKGGQGFSWDVASQVGPRPASLRGQGRVAGMLHPAYAAQRVHDAHLQAGRERLAVLQERVSGSGNPPAVRAELHDCTRCAPRRSSWPSLPRATPMWPFRCVHVPTLPRAGAAAPLPAPALAPRSLCWPVCYPQWSCHRGRCCARHAGCGSR